MISLFYFILSRFVLMISVRTSRELPNGPSFVYVEKRTAFECNTLSSTESTGCKWCWRAGEGRVRHSVYNKMFACTICSSGSLYIYLWWIRTTTIPVVFQIYKYRQNDKRDRHNLSWLIESRLQYWKRTSVLPPFQ